MNHFIKVMCFIGGANIEILQKCPTEKNGFIATGVGIINVVTISIIAMGIKSNTVLSGSLFPLLVSVFYGFIIFIAYWGILSIMRKTIKYDLMIKGFAFISLLVFSYIASLSVLFYINRSFGLTVETVVIFLVVLFVYFIPIILRLLISSSGYEEEKERMERNFIAQKEADIIAYKQKYNDYALHFNDANIKMESIRHLGTLSKEYHELMNKMLKNTFDHLNKLEKSNASHKKIVEDCKNSIEEQFKATLEKMSKIFSGI